MSSSTLSVALLFSPSTVTLEGNYRRRGGKEESTWVTKVGSVGDGASPLAGVQVEGSFSTTGPGMEKLRNSCLDSEPVGHPGSLEARHSETGWRGFYPPPLKKCIQADEAWLFR